MGLGANVIPLRDYSEPVRIGRKPKLVLSDELLKQIEGLGAIQATKYEAADFFGVSYTTFTRFRRKYPQVDAAYERGIGRGKVSLRRRQFDMAKTNAAMAIWLGKQWLGQEDKHEVRAEVDHYHHDETELDNYTLDELKTLRDITHAASSRDVPPALPKPNGSGQENSGEESS